MFGFTDFTDSSGCTSLHYCKDERTFHMLVGRGANIHSVDGHQRTVLMSIVYNTSRTGDGVPPSVIDRLWLSINNKDAGGNTALMYAAIYLNPTTFANLLRGGASRVLTNNGGMTVKDYLTSIRGDVKYFNEYAEIDKMLGML
jgi:hypothetical protein